MREANSFSNPRKNTHVRLAYLSEIEPGGIVIRLFDYVRGDFDHEEYLKIFRERSKYWEGSEFVIVPLPKAL